MITHDAEETTMARPDDKPTEGLVRFRSPQSVVLMPVMDVALAKSRLQELQEFCANYLQESQDGGQDGGDYGVIPGTGGKRKALFKSGAEKLCDVYGLADRYRILSSVEDFDSGLFDYVIECSLVRKTDEMFVGSGLGSCSSYEAKYRWREGKRVCPTCGADSIIKGKAEYGGGWVCWRSKGGCGAKFAATDPKITDQKVGRVENPDIVDAKNTVLKIAKKRAKIDAVISVTRSSGLFTQDLQEHEDGHEPVPEEMEPVAPAASGTEASAAPAGESHAAKIARVKAEAAARRAKEDKAITESLPKPPADAPADTLGPPNWAEAGPPPEPAAPASESAAAASAPAEPFGKPVPEGTVLVTSINVRNGPMQIKDGVQKPAWGPLYVVTFSAKVKASDDKLVLDATTFDETVAGQAETARDTHTPVRPVVTPGGKKGSYNLTGFAA